MQLELYQVLKPQVQVRVQVLRIQVRVQVQVLRSCTRVQLESNCNSCSVSWCICISIVHPAKTTGQNEMPFGRDTRLVPSNTVLDTCVPPYEGEIWGSEPQFTAMLPIVKLL